MTSRTIVFEYREPSGSEVTLTEEAGLVELRIRWLVDSSTGDWAQIQNTFPSSSFHDAIGALISRGEGAVSGLERGALRLRSLQGNGTWLDVVDEAEFRPTELHVPLNVAPVELARAQHGLPDSRS
jgi:hypothetical protein